MHRRQVDATRDFAEQMLIYVPQSHVLDVAELATRTLHNLQWERLDTVDPLRARAQEHDRPAAHLVRVLGERLESFQIVRVDAARGLDLNRSGCPAPLALLQLVRYPVLL